jgi:MFS family permease
MLGPMSAELRRNVWIETIASIFFGIFWATTIGFFPVILRKMGASSDALSVYVVFQSLGLIFTPISAALFQRFRIIKTSSIIWYIGRSMMLLVPFVGGSVPLFMVLVGVFWVCELMPAPGYVRLLERLYPDNLRGRIMGFVRIGMTSAILLMTPTAGWLFDTFDYQIVLPCIAVAGLTANFIFSKLRGNDAPAPVDPTHHAPTFREVMTELGRNRAFLMFILMNTIFGCGTLIGAPLYADVQVARLHLTYTEVGYLGTLQSVTWLLGNFVWGGLIDKRGPRVLLLLSILCAATLPFSFMLATSFWWLVPAYICQGLLLGGFDIAFTNTAIALADRSKLETYFAALHVVGGVRGIAIPLITPLLVAAHVDYTVIFAIGGALVLVSALLVYRIRMPQTAVV